MGFLTLCPNVHLFLFKICGEEEFLLWVQLEHVLRELYLKVPSQRVLWEALL